MMKKVLKITGIVILTIFIGCILYLYFSLPKLPENTGSIIEKVLDSEELVEHVNGKAGYVINDSINIWYESITPQDSSKGVILLFMGISNDALGWPQSFLNSLVDSGYQVIRYDYRGTGFSDWIENWEEHSYSLTDLAEDAKLILDSLKIEQANLIGVSMGGMVAQDFAIQYPDRTNSLTSIMSSGNIIDKELPSISTKIVFELVKASIGYGLIPGDKSLIKMHIASRVILQGEAKYELDVEEIAKQVRYNLHKRKGYNPDASKQHHEATYRSGSRYDDLKKLETPVLIIHGKNDPFIPFEHSVKMAALIPGARTKWIDNMGHDIPQSLYDTILNEIFTTINSRQDQ